MKCAAEDMRGQDCKPIEGKYDGRPQFYCARCSAKNADSSSSFDPSARSRRMAECVSYVV